jgi:hypothetical protein
MIRIGRNSTPSGRGAPGAPRESVPALSSRPPRLVENCNQGTNPDPSGTRDQIARPRMGCMAWPARRNRCATGQLASGAASSRTAAGLSTHAPSSGADRG